MRKFLSLLVVLLMVITAVLLWGTQERTAQKAEMDKHALSQP